MTGFHTHDGTLACDGVPLDEIASAYGTPLYVYSGATIADRYRALDDAFAAYPHGIHYALKANSALAILRLLRSLGSAADANSAGEIDVARRAGFTPDQIVFTGVGKTDDELRHAIGLGVRSINVESGGELERVAELSRAQQRRTRIALRLNPDVDAKTHPHISTGLKTNKFGVGLGEVKELAQRARVRDSLQLVGLHAHIGSQITDLQPLARAAATLVGLARELSSAGTRIEHIDLGGGLGVSYDGSTVPTAADYAQAVLPIVRESGLTLVLEPGRFVIAPAGALLTRVVDVKAQEGGRRFVIMDAGMTELIRPMLYNAFHRIVPVLDRGGPEIRCDVVGPLCESSDTLGKDRPLPDPQVSDLYAVLDTGAYGSVMASNYNRRVMPGEVLVEGGAPRLIRRRQTLEDLLALES